MTHGHDDRIGELAKLIDSEKSTEKVLALAEELARILAAEATTDKTPTKPTVPEGSQFVSDGGPRCQPGSSLLNPIAGAESK